MASKMVVLTSQITFSTFVLAIKYSDEVSNYPSFGHQYITRIILFIIIIIIMKN